MKIIDIDKDKNIKPASAIALGNFDGVHIGHQNLISSLVDFSKSYQLKAGVLLFANHTKKMIGNKNIKLLTSNKQKLQLFSEFGIEMIYKAEFTKEIRKLSPESFIKNILIDMLNTRFITVGFNYRFGYGAKGDVNLLKVLGNKYGFSVNIIEPQYINNIIISSTAIRDYLSSGEISKANTMLNRNYSVIGIPSKTNITMEDYVYPKLNITIMNQFMLPKTGLYISKCKFKNGKYLSFTNIFKSPLVEDDKLKVEVYLIRNEDKVFENLIEIEFIEYIGDFSLHDNKNCIKEYIYDNIEFVKSKY